MHSRADCSPMVKRLMCAGLIVAVASLGAVIVRNVTEMLAEITHPSTSFTVVDRPNR